jgi:regulator of protease activity HflC (stomatin/prohibitin superfamily)
MDAAAGFPLSHILTWAGSLIGFGIALQLIWSLAIGPRWQVWASHQKGLADLAQANNEQQIQISKAKSRLDAAQLNKQAAIVEAEAVAEQVKAIGTQLTQHDLYLRWQWIKMMEDNGSSAKVIYVPTEANLPILEATRLKN